VASVVGIPEIKASLRKAAVKRLRQIGVCKEVSDALSYDANSDLASAVFDALRAVRADTALYNALANVRPKAGEMILLVKFLDGDCVRELLGPGVLSRLRRRSRRFDGVRVAALAIKIRSVVPTDSAVQIFGEVTAGPPNALTENLLQRWTEYNGLDVATCGFPTASRCVYDL
jgi:hypothetical protein